jgi:hypothetical protein
MAGAQGVPYSTYGQMSFEYGMQNSRGFRGLKVWLALRQTANFYAAARALVRMSCHAAVTEKT